MHALVRSCAACRSRSGVAQRFGRRSCRKPPQRRPFPAAGRRCHRIHLFARRRNHCSTAARLRPSQPLWPSRNQQLRISAPPPDCVPDPFQRCVLHHRPRLVPALARIPTLESALAEPERAPTIVCSAWNAILTIDYHPVFAPARAALETLSDRHALQPLRLIAENAIALADELAYLVPVTKVGILFICRKLRRFCRDEDWPCYGLLSVI